MTQPQPSHLAAPPRLAAWMLNHLTPPARDEALAGDLLEDFRAGRSSAWYWRQVFAAIAFQWLRTLADHKSALFFAAAWSLLSPAWQLILRRLDHAGALTGPLWRLPWPWSTVCAFGAGFFEGLIFLWTGVLLCLVPLAPALRNINLRRIARALALSIPAFVIPSAGEIALILLTAPGPTHAPVDWRTLTILGVIENFGIWALLGRLPYFIGVAWALCATIPVTGAQSAQTPAG